MDYKQEQQRLNKLDVDFDDFKETLDDATLEMAKNKLGSLSMFDTDESKKDAIEKSQSELKSMTWEEIFKQSCNWGVRIEGAMTVSQEQARDPQHWEDQRIRKGGV